MLDYEKYRLVFNLKVINDFVVSNNNSMILITSAIIDSSNHTLTISVFEVLQPIFLIVFSDFERNQSLYPLHNCLCQRML